MIKDAQDIKVDFLFSDILISSLRAGNKISFSAKGTSMYPTIREGDILHIEPFLPEDICKRDIILYKENDGVIAHRLVYIRRKQGKASFFTCGDSSSGTKEVSDNQILGRLSSYERQGKQFSLNNSLGYYLYIKLRCFFVRIFRKLPFGIHNKFVALKRLILT